MRKQYVTPMVKVVEFRAERGFCNSAFQRATDGIFSLTLIDDEARGERFSEDNWNTTSPTEAGNLFTEDTWGTL